MTRPSIYILSFREFEAIPQKKGGSQRNPPEFLEQSAKKKGECPGTLPIYLFVNGVFQALAGFEFRLCRCRNLHWLTRAWVTACRSFTL